MRVPPFLPLSFSSLLSFPSLPPSLSLSLPLPPSLLFTMHSSQVHVTHVHYIRMLFSLKSKSCIIHLPYHNHIHTHTHTHTQVRHTCFHYSGISHTIHPHHPLTTHTHHTHPHTPGTGRHGVRNDDVINVKGRGGRSGTFLAQERSEGGCTREGERGGGGAAVVMKYVIALLLGS